MKTPISTIIVEDDEHSITCLTQLLTNFPEVHVLDTVRTVKDAISSILTHSPSLVFLDIEMPDGTSFDIIRLLKNVSFDIIITSAHNQYASEAFDHSALHYLTKPLKKEALAKALRKYRERTVVYPVREHNEQEGLMLNDRMEKFALASYDEPADY